MKVNLLWQQGPSHFLLMKNNFISRCGKIASVGAIDRVEVSLQGFKHCMPEVYDHTA